MAKNSNRPRWLRSIKHGIEAGFALLAFGLFRILPPDTASAFGGWLLRRVGPKLGAARRVNRNLDLALPGLTDQEKQAIARGMWDNLGRVIAEYAHLSRLWNEKTGRVTLVNAGALQTLLNDGQPAILFGGHLANWELCAIGAGRHGLPLGLVYRAPNNPLVHWLIKRARSAGGGTLIPKGAAGGRQIMNQLKAGGHIAMLLDQKMNDGIAVPFFGHDAMTAPAAAQLALRFRCPLVPIQVERLGGARFRITIEDPIPLPDSGDKAADTRAVMLAINARLEAWIRQNPAQWLWVHSRWPDHR